jgi:hypothetical protein
MKKQLFCGIFASSLALNVMAQAGNTLSPYSQFGLGVLADQSHGFNRGMSGAGIGLRGSDMVNVQNPASYSAVDSLTMIFDMGVSGQITNFKEGGKKVNAHTADFDYIVTQFRVMRKMGVSVGIIPFSNIGYNCHVTEFVPGSRTNTTTSTYKGSGGLSQGYVGIGWEAFKGFSVGANLSYLWGTYERTASNINSDTYVNSETQTYRTSINSYKLDFGVQYQKAVSRHDVLTVGATVGIGHKLGAIAEFSRTNTNSQTSVSSTTTDSIDNAFAIPFSFGVGASLVHNNSLTIAADYTLQKWSSLDFPYVNSNTSHYEMASGMLSDRHRIAVGADWLPSPNPATRSLFKRIHYRAGISYATPYYKIGTHDGPKELTVSGGFAVPIRNTWNNRSFVNISAQWVRVSQPSFITENTFRINIGLTFNERWFAKWKVD